MHTFSSVLRLVDVCGMEAVWAHSEASFSCMKLPSTISTTLYHMWQKTDPFVLKNTSITAGTNRWKWQSLVIISAPTSSSLFPFSQLLVILPACLYDALSSTNTQKPKCMTHTQRRAGQHIRDWSTLVLLKQDHLIQLKHFSHTCMPFTTSRSIEYHFID